MKRILLFSAALCCISLWSCNNDQGNLSPEELEIIKLNELIASQSGFDEEALIKDLLNGVFISKTTFLYRNGKCIASSLDLWCGVSPLPQPVVFFKDGTCKMGSLDPITLPELEDSTSIEVECTWRYDSTTRSIITDMAIVGTELIYTYTAKILYYKDHIIVWEGDILGSIGIDADGEQWADYMRTSGYIDMESRDLYVNTLK